MSGKRIHHRVHRRVQHHKWPLLSIIAVGLTCFLVVLSMGILYTGKQEQKRIVTFYDYGRESSILTSADTVEAALRESTIALNPQDEVEPDRTAKLSSPSEDIIIYRSRLVAIQDGATRQSVVTVSQSPNAIVESAKMKPLSPNDTASLERGELASDGTAILLKINRAKAEEPPAPEPVVFVSKPNALTPSKGAQVYVDSAGVAHRETYYDLPMNIVIRACGAGGSYSVRSDGAKVDQDGFVLVAANLRSYPRCSIVDTSLGPGKVYDTGGFALKHPYGFDLATDWTNYNGL